MDNSSTTDVTTYAPQTSKTPYASLKKESKQENDYLF
jgi:hypothetical protein